VKYANLGYSIRDGVASISLNRPEAYNALNLEMTRELFIAAIRADDDASVRAIILTGAGKAFCGGGDVKSFADAGAGAPSVLKELTTYLHAAISRLCRARKPVLTAINGVAAGGGMSLALTGDLVLAAESARFTMAYSKIAAAPDGSSTYFLPRLIGMRRAFELYYTNRVLSAREAMDWGLVNRVHADAELAAAAQTLAAELAQGPTYAFSRARELLQRSSEESLETPMELEAQAIAACGSTRDFQRAVVAFTKKETPKFEGR
jgi:2-(1,2-epoxy-1,2-dihydrophenyl)acetyl-CoA isomerase